ncbi:M56 family metallopeptidase [Mucilaginibacter ximonensis]|uniref:M56 family metallopeptidase n=1 Tax=Mucilaginibacter ximonensis TaxID=538021 RepID=A0ABW5Y808_9SPHI
MPALFVFLLKVNIALIAFCLGYYLVLRKLTFYTLNRFYLVLGIIFSSFYPFVNIDSFIHRHKLESIQQVVVNLKAPAQKLLSYPWYWNWAATIFWLGAAVFAARLLLQFLSLYKIYRSSKQGTLQQYNVRITDADISPFSFWQSIFINPDKVENTDLKSILQHEQVHVSEWHTLDILLAEVSVIFYWFNPGIWLMKKAVSENIEFITDRKILQQGADSKEYQYSLLNVSLGTKAPANITNHFNFSTLKKRIRMMNARRSSKINLTRYAVLMPAVIICLCIFSITKADIVKKSKIAYKTIFTSVHNFVGTTAARPVVKPRKKLVRKTLLQYADTAKMLPLPLPVPLTFQIKNDSISRHNQTFEIKRIPGQSTAYLINGREVSAEKFDALRPHVQRDTINIVAKYPADQKALKHMLTVVQNGTGSIQTATFQSDDADRADKVITGIQIKRHDDGKGEQTGNVEATLTGKPVKKVFMIRADYITSDTSIKPRGTISHTRINGKDVTEEELKKLAPNLANKAQVISAQKATPREIRKIRIDGKDATMEELYKLDPKLIQKMNIVNVKAGSSDSTNKDIEVTTKSGQ